MRMRFLGKSGIKVSELCLGTMIFGTSAVGRKEADNIIGMALDEGINFFDTADIYVQGQSEEILGKALGTRRKDVILATKVCNRTGPGPNDAGLSRRHILEACDASLKRLGTDYIDLYYIHRWVHVRPLEETLRTLDDLVHQGKVRYIGCSNLTGWQLMKALAMSKEYNLERFIALEANYSLLSKGLELELVPLCLDQGIGITAYSPLLGGYLSGKYRKGKPRPKDSRWSDANPKTPTGKDLIWDQQQADDIVDELERIATSHNGTIGQAALNYLLSKPVVSSVIIGSRTIEQLTDNLKTTEWQMLPEEVTRLDNLSEIPLVYPYRFQADFYEDDSPKRH